ncbi:MAG TPA: hypothetical protein DDX71_03395 [Ruminococcus sp.]|nr:hypothetical protein [Ruminococcus sp.]
MKAMTLLKAMSEIDLRDIEAAAEAGAGGVRTYTEDAAEDPPSAGAKTSLPMPALNGNFRKAAPETESAGGRGILRWRIAGFAAAAACFALTAGAVLHFRGQDDGFVASPSQPVLITEITAADTTAPAVQTVSAVTTSVTQQNQTGSTAQMTVTTLTTGAVSGDETAESGTDSAPEDVSTEETVRQTEETSLTTTTAVSQLRHVRVPALLLTGDCGGELGSESELTIIREADAIQAYLSGKQPEIMLGTGHKSAEEVSAIENSPVLLRIRWQAESPRWESYGLGGVSIDHDGVLHVLAECYCPTAEIQEKQPWIYETSLLIEADKLPEIRGMHLDLDEHIEEDDSILSWLRYSDALSDDISIEYYE